MTEPLLRIAYFAIAIYTYAGAMFTCAVADRSKILSALDILSLGSIWLSFLAFVAIVVWASVGERQDLVPETVIRAASLTAGLFLATCALASAMVMTQGNALMQDWFCVGGLWVSFVLFCAVISISSKAKRDHAGGASFAAA